MNAVQGMAAPEIRNYADPRMPAPMAPRRSEVIRLSSSLDQLHKALMDHADRLDPILRPQPPMPGPPTTAVQPESRLASEVSRIDDLIQMLSRLTERIEA